MDDEILRRLEAIEQTICAGLVTLVALLQMPQEERELHPLPLDDAIEMVRRTAKGMGYKFPAEI